MQMLETWNSSLAMKTSNAKTCALVIFWFCFVPTMVTTSGVIHEEECKRLDTVLSYFYSTL